MIAVNHISSAPFGGGAARAGYRLHQSFNGSEAVDSLWLDAGNPPDAPGMVRVKKPALERSLFTRVKYRLQKDTFNQLPPHHGTPRSNPRGWGSPDLLKRVRRPDVWNLHWVSWFLDWQELLPWMAEQAPIVWTLHDLNPLRGIWHYEPGTSEVDALSSSLESAAVQEKRRALERIPKNRITFIGPSRWMTEEVKNSAVTGGFPVKTIPYGLDTDLFCPQEQNLLRPLCGIDESASVIGFLADSAVEPRKGMASLQEAISQVARRHPVHVVTVGKDILPLPGCPQTHLGPLQSDRLLSHFYSGCDIFVCSSLQDNLPNTVLESMSCGTPVVSFATGGLPDMVREGTSGITVSPVGDGRALGEAISELLSDPHRLAEWGTAARSLALREYDRANQASAYIALYQTLAASAS